MKSPLSLFGIVLIAVGVLAPTQLAEALRATPLPAGAQLALGALLFKAGLCVLGVSAIVLPRLGFLWGTASVTESRRVKPTGVGIMILLVVLVVVATALRLYGLNGGLWLDEMLADVGYVQQSVGDILTTYDSQNQHPLFSLLAHFSTGAFGDVAWSLRLPAAMFGVASIVALYLLGREVATPREGFLAATLMALSYEHIWFSQNARGYSGLLFWALLASWILVRALNRGERRLWVAYAVVSALGVYTHLTMLFIIVAHFGIYLTALVTRRKQVWPHRWAGLPGFFLAGLFTFQLHALVLPQLLGSALGEVSTVPLWTNPLWAVLEVVQGFQVSFALGFVAVVALVIFGAGLVSYARTAPAVVQLLLVPVALEAATTIASGHHVWPRLFFFSLGFGVLVVIRGGLVLGEWAARRAHFPAVRVAWVGTALCLSMAAVSAMSIPRVYGPKQDYAGALALVQATEQPGDQVTTAGLATFPYNHFLRMGWQEVEQPDELAALRTRANRTWFVYTLSDHMQAVYPELLAYVQRNFEPVGQFPGTLGDGTVYVYRAGPASTAEVGVRGLGN
jgi:mannosyltransferase